MTNIKKWYASRTVWAGILSALSGVFGLALPVDVISGHIVDGVTVVGGIMAVWGRMRATDVLK